MCIRCSREMIDVLQRRNHIICPYGPGLYGFIHRTFLEYLCADAIIWRFKEDRSLSIEEIRDSYVLRHCREDAWHEVIRLLTAQLQPHFANDLITALVPTPTETDGHDMRLQLAFQCLAEREPRQLTQFASLCNLLLDALYAWFEGRSDSGRWREFEEKQRFATHVGSALAVVGINWPNPGLDWRGLPRANPRALFIRAVYSSLIASLAGSIWSKLPETKPLLLDRARNDQDAGVRGAALGALAEHFRDAPETKPLLLDHARNDQGADVRWAALGALAEHFRDAPETKPLLLDRARNDEDATVRGAALGALAEHFRDAAETKPLLLDRARNDEDAYVRGVAIRALAEHFRDAAETKPLLLDRARNDEDADMRGAALGALAEHFRDAPETKPLLLDRAPNDEDAGVRGAAIRALAEHFRDAPETQPLLLDRARNDQGANVRWAAIRALAEHFRDAPETKPLLLDRARTDEDADVRRAALISWAQAYSNERNARLLSRDLDGVAPGLDPHEPVSEAQVEQAAERLRLTPDEVRAAYEELARQVPLTLSWQLPLP
jgi:HEAT repeat protein